MIEFYFTSEFTIEVNIYNGDVMRFIFNFVFFGILFYLIFLFFPDAFHTLVGWVNQVYVFLRDLVMQVVEKFHEHSGDVAPKVPAHALLMSMLKK